jgi:CRP-like cAMP-binding protein
MALPRLSGKSRSAVAPSNSIHLAAELHDRTRNAGLARNDRYPLPLTQSQFGEVPGVSLVHINRTMQQLRRDGLIELKSGWASILDRERMELLCDDRTIVL